MQINAVSTKATTFGQHYPSREELENFANADDRTLRYFATKAASEQVNDKKHRTVNNVLWYSLPIAGGLSALVDPKFVGRMPKLKAFGASAAGWAVALAAVDAVNYGRKVALKNSDSLREFNNEHPFLNAVLAIGVAIGAIFLANKGVDKLIDKYGKDVMKHVRSLNIYKSVKESKLITDIMKTVRKAPSSIKSLAKGLMECSPWILVGTSIAHSMFHERAKSIVTAGNYATLKTNQQQVRQVLAVNDEIDRIKAEASQAADDFEDVD